MVWGGVARWGGFGSGEDGYGAFLYGRVGFGMDFLNKIIFRTYAKCAGEG